jgi:hypothetical protein
MIRVVRDPVGSERDDGVGPHLGDGPADGVDHGLGVSSVAAPVGEPQQPQVGDPELAQALAQLPLPPGREPLRSVLRRIVGAPLAPGGSDHRHVPTRLDDTGHQAGREVGLVVGVGPDPQEPVGEGTRNPVVSAVQRHVGAGGGGGVGGVHPEGSLREVVRIDGVNVRIPWSPTLEAT